jgi:hypothetical protein
MAVAARRHVAVARLAYPMLGIAAAGYSVVALELAFAGAMPMPEPFLRIADADYFAWGALFYAPVIIAAWFIGSGVAYGVAHAFGVRADFDRLRRALAFATGIGTLGTLVPDLITSPLRATGVISEQAWEASIASASATLIAYLVLFAVAYPVAVTSATRLRTWRAAVAGLAAFAAFQGFEFVFIR